MPIKRDGDFLVSRDLGITPSIGIESEKLAACIAQAQAYEGVFGSPGFGFREDNLNFLADMEHLRQVWFTDCEFSSIHGIYALQNLEYCGVMKKRPGIDYSKFPKLRTLVAHWNPKDTGLAESTIQKFYLWHYKPRSKSFEGAAFPLEVEELELNWVNPSSLAGITHMPRLRELGIHRSRNLEDLSMLPVLAPNLKKLIVTSSKNLTQLSGIEDHPSIELAIIEGKRIRG